MPEFDGEGRFGEKPANEDLLIQIADFLNRERPLVDMRQMDQEVCQIITTEEYNDYRSLKGYNVEELGKLNKTPGFNGALNSAIERGFIIGYWFGMQHSRKLEDV